MPTWKLRMTAMPYSEITYSKSMKTKYGGGGRMASDCASVNKSTKEDGLVMLMKDRKIISRVQHIGSPIKLLDLNIVEIKVADKFDLSGLHHFLLRPACDNDHQRKEWSSFTKFLLKHNRVARVETETCILYILPPDQGTQFNDAIVFYRVRRRNKCNKSDGAFLEASTGSKDAENLNPVAVLETPHPVTSDGTDERLHEYVMEGERKNLGVIQPRGRFYTNGKECGDGRIDDLSSKTNDYVVKNYVRADPTYLKTLAQTHSGWIFGAIAELVDNSRDAKATKLEISIKPLVMAGKKIPMLSFVDNGLGMSHLDIVRMLSFGGKAPDGADQSRIGRYGIGFKTGSMRIGQDAIVLTQTTKSRSIGFLSQSFNEGKDMLEIPIVSYCLDGSLMEFDTSVQSKATAEYNLKVIKEFSCFNEYFIGELFATKGIGTQIYIWNLDEWGSNYSLEWENKGDILIRSRRIRRRPGQIGNKVPLDYSLRSYLEVIFLEPRMKIYVQGSPVKSHPLAISLNKTAIVKGNIMEKSLHLTLGRSQLEWERMNCGIFLYWHGRLIEAYNRVGGMIHNADMGRGVIGVIDVTNLMNDGNNVWVHNNKQGFQDCEAYAKLEEWLGQRTDEYWDNNFDSLQVKKINARYKPDHEWVQCDKCRKWRLLSSGYDIKSLPQEWFCYMQPFSGKCETPEQQLDGDVVTVAAKRTGCDSEPK